MEHTPPEAPSDIQPITIEEATIPGVEFRFVECVHTVENGDRIARLLRGCDVVAFEDVDDNEANRKTWSDIYTEYVSTTISEATRTYYDEKIPNRFIASVLRGLHDTEQQIALIDISEDHPDAYLLQEVDKKRDQLRHAIWLSADNQTISDGAVALAKAKARSHTAREAVQVSQLLELAHSDEQATEATGDKKIIGVVAGSNHWRVRESVIQHGFLAKHKVVGLEKDEQDTSYEDQVIEHLRADPEATLEPALMNRLTLEALCLFHDTFLATGSSRTLHNRALAGKVAYEAIQHLDDARVDQILQDLDAYKHRAAAQNPNWLTMPHRSNPEVGSWLMSTMSKNDAHPGTLKH